MRILFAVLMAPVCSSCGSSEAPTPVASLVIGQPSPSAGSVIRPTNSFIVRESGTLSIPITATSDREVDWAALYVYLLSSDSGRDYCGQNLPDTPTWGPFRKGQTVTVTITGFQVGRMPCQVTGIRAMLHTRNSGLLTPPTASETIAEATMRIAYSLQ